MNDLLNIGLYGLTAGSQYALVALGFSLIYSVLGIIHFAHGNLVAVGAYVCWLFSVGGLSLPLPIAAVIAMAVTGAISLVLGRYVLMPAKAESNAVALVAAIGLAFVLQSALSLFFSGEAKAFTSSATAAPLPFLPAKWIHAVTLVLSLLLLSLLWFGLLKRTTFGIETRACASNPVAALRFGLRRKLVFGAAFFVSGAFAALAGVLVGLDDQMITPEIGFTLGLRAFAASLIGSIGNVPGAIAGAFLLGMIENVIAHIVYSLPGMMEFSALFSKDVTALLLLVLILAWKPRGLFAPSFEPRP